MDDEFAIYINKNSGNRLDQNTGVLACRRAAL